MSQGRARHLLAVIDFMREKIRSQVAPKDWDADHFYQTLHEAGQLVLTFSPDKFTIAQCSPAVASALGSTVNEVCGQRLTNFLTDSAQLDSALKRCFEQGRASFDTIIINQKNAATDTEIELIENPLDVGGPILAVLFPRQSDSQQMDFSETARFIQNFSLDILFVLDEQGVIRYISSSIINLLGIPENELIGKSYTDFLPESQWELAAGKLQETLQHGSISVYETRLMHRDGTEVPVEIQGKTGDRNGQQLIQGTIRDVRQRVAKKTRQEEDAEHLLRLSDATHEAIVISEHGICIECNRKAADLFGYQPEEMIGLSAAAVIDPQSRAAAQQNINTHFPKPYEAMAVRKDGSRFWVEIEGKRVDLEGRTLRISAIRDLTKWKETEDRRALSEARFSAMFESIKDAVVYLSFTGRVIEANSATLTMFGGSREELIGKRFTKLGFFTPAEIPNLLKTFSMAMKQERLRTEVEIVNRKGIKYFLESNTSFFALDNKKVGLLVVSRDITERRLSEQKQRESEAQYRNLYNAVPDAVFIHRLEKENVPGRFIEVNEVACRRLGYPRAELLQMTPADIVPGLDPATYREFLARIRAGEQVILESAHRTCEGRILDIEAHSTYVEFEGIPAVLAIVRDISQIKQVRETRKRLIQITQDVEDYTEEEFLRLSLESAVELSDSQIGYLHFVNEDQESISLQMWSAKTMSLCDVPNKIEHYPISEAGVWVDCIHQKRSVIHNDYLSLPHKKGLPEGHSPVFRDLGVPVFEDGKIVAVLGVGNKAFDYDQADVEALETVAQTIWINVRRKRAENALRQSEEKFRHMAENSPELIYRYRILPEPMFEFVSPSATVITGYTPEEHYADPMLGFKLVHPDDREKLQQVATGQKESNLIVLRWIRKDGKVIWTEQNNSPILDKSGNLIALDGVARDVTKRVEAQHKIEESERKYRLLFETMSFGIFYLNREGEITSANDAAARIFGMSSDIATGKTVLTFKLQFIHEDGTWFKQEELPALKALRTGETQKNIIAGLVHPVNKAVTWIDITAVPQFLPGESAAHEVYAIAEDITENRIAENKMKRLSTAIEQAVEMFVITDIHGNILYVNPAFEKITGYSLQEVVGKTPRILKSGKMSSEFYKDLWSTISAGNTWSGKLINRAKDGHEYTEETIISPVLNANGKIENFVAVKRDVTREQSLEEQLRQAQKLDAIGRLAGGVAHDFNNLLTIINGYTDLISDDVHSDPEMSDKLEQIRQAGSRAESLTRQLLAFSRKQEAKLQIMSLNKIVEESTKLYRRIIGEDIHIEIQLTKSPTTIEADPHQVDQVLMNLLLNARDAIQDVRNTESNKRIEITTEELILDKAGTEKYLGSKPGRNVCLRLRDDGIGMTPEVRDQIFEPFFTTKSVGRGTGLGLSTVYGLVGQSGGTIHVTSEAGVGTEFAIIWPEAIIKQPAPQTQSSFQNAVGGSEVILLVEDEAGVRNITKKALSRLGYEVLSAENSFEAQQIFSEHQDKIQLLLTDVVMPGQSGVELATLLRKQVPQLPVIFISGYTDRHLTEDSSGEDKANFIQKPFQIKTLDDMIRKVCS